MSDRDLDRDLSERFDSLRARDAGGAPAFDRVWRTALQEASSRARGASRRAAAWVAAVGAVAAIAAGIVLLAPRPGGAPIEETIAKAAEISSWSAPTDPFLDLTALDHVSGAASGDASRSKR